MDAQPTYIQFLEGLAEQDADAVRDAAAAIDSEGDVISGGDIPSICITDQLKAARGIGEVFEQGIQIEVRESSVMVEGEEEPIKVRIVEAYYSSQSFAAVHGLRATERGWKIVVSHSDACMTALGMEPR